MLRALVAVGAVWNLASLYVDTHDVISQHTGIEEEILLFGHVVAEQSNQIEQHASNEGRRATRVSQTRQHVAEGFTLLAMIRSHAIRSLVPPRVRFAERGLQVAFLPAHVTIDVDHQCVSRFT